MSPTHVKRQTTSRAAAPKAAARGASNAKTKDDSKQEKGQTVATPAKTVEASPSLDVQVPAPDSQEAPAAPATEQEAPASAEDTQEAPAVPRASLLQALATGQKVEAVTGADDTTASESHAALATGKRDVWTTDEDAVEAMVIADLFKATVDGYTHFGYRGTIITLPKDKAAHGLRFGALTKEF